MRHQVIQDNKFCLNKYLLIEKQVQEEECCDKLKKLNNDVFGNVEVRYIF